MTDYCMCGHMQYKHQKAERFNTNGLFYCFDCDCMKYKLDNLRFIEDEAKERGLV